MTTGTPTRPCRGWTNGGLSLSGNLGRGGGISYYLKPHPGVPKTLPASWTLEQIFDSGVLVAWLAGCRDLPFLSAKNHGLGDPQDPQMGLGSLGKYGIISEGAELGEI